MFAASNTRRSNLLGESGHTLRIACRVTVRLLRTRPASEEPSVETTLGLLGGARLPRAGLRVASRRGWPGSILAPAGVSDNDRAWALCASWKRSGAQVEVEAVEPRNRAVEPPSHQTGLTVRRGARPRDPRGAPRACGNMWRCMVACPLMFSLTKRRRPRSSARAQSPLAPSSRRELYAPQPTDDVGSRTRREDEFV